MKVYFVYYLCDVKTVELKRWQIEYNGVEFYSAELPSTSGRLSVVMVPELHRQNPQIFTRPAYVSVGRTSISSGVL